MAEKKDNGPVKQFRVGAIGVSVFKREVEVKGKTEVFYNATPSRAYTKDNGETWEYSDSFGRDELPVVAQLLNLAFLWIVQQSAR